MTRILVIDDEALVRGLMVEILEDAGYEALGAATDREAIDRLGREDVSLVVSDIVMPGLSGLELLDEVRRRRPSLPVVLVTGAGTYDNLQEALARGADGLVQKPFSPADLIGAVAGALERAGLAQGGLREGLLAPTLASALANAIELRDAGTQGHCERLSDLAVRLAHAVGLPYEEIAVVRLGAILHDVGKIGTLDGLAGEAIPLAARIVAVADAVEAMSAVRPYRSPLALEAIVRELRAGRGTQWDPAITDHAVHMVESGSFALEAA